MNKLSDSLIAQVDAIQEIAKIDKDAMVHLNADHLKDFAAVYVNASERIKKAQNETQAEGKKVLGIDFNTLDQLMNRASKRIMEFSRALSGEGDMPDLKSVTGIIQQMTSIEKKFGAPIQLEEWVKALDTLRKVRSEVIAMQKSDGGNGSDPAGLSQVEEKTEQTGKVIAQLDDKFIETFTNIGNSITDLIGKMDKLYDEGIKVSNIFDQADGATPPWADWFKETTGQQGIADMNDGVLMLVESLDKLTGQMTHVVQIINRLFLNNGSNAFFDDARAGIEMMIDGLIALGDKADQAQTELSRLGGINTGIDAATMQQLIDAAVKKGAQSADTLNRKLAQQKKIMNEIFALQDMRNKGMGDAQKIQERLVKLGQQYAKNMKDMQGMDGYDEAEETLRNFIQDKVAKVDYKDTQAEIKGLENAVRRLAKAQNEYISAVKIGNTEGARRAQDEIEDAKEEIRLRDEVVQKLKLTTEQEERRKKA